MFAFVVLWGFIRRLVKSSASHGWSFPFPEARSVGFVLAFVIALCHRVWCGVVLGVAFAEAWLVAFVRGDEIGRSATRRGRN